MKFTLILLLALNFAVAMPAFGGPGGSTTPFPFGQAPEDLVGTWINQTYNATIIVQHVQSLDGKSDRLFVVMNQGSSHSQGYLYYTGNGFCGVLFNGSGRNAPMCLKGRFGLLSVEGEKIRIYFTHARKLSKR